MSGIEQDAAAIINDLENKVVLLSQLALRVMNEYAGIGIPNVPGTVELRSCICDSLGIVIDDSIKNDFLRQNGRRFEEWVVVTLATHAASQPQ